MFKSVASIASASSIPISKSSIASSLGNSKISSNLTEELDEYAKYVGKEDLSQSDLYGPIDELESYDIPLLDDSSASHIFANLGCGIASAIGLLTNTSVDFPDHWFLIATVKGYSYDEKLLMSKFKECLNAKGRKELENGTFKPSLEELIKIYEIKNEIKKEVNNYYLIEKVETAKIVKWYKDKDEALKKMSETYHNNQWHKMIEYTFNKKTSIKDIIDYIKTLSDSYNLINDNCQVFVKSILCHYNLDYFDFIPDDDDPSNISPEDLVFHEN